MATTACPNSCNTTDPKMMATNPIPRAKLAGPLFTDSLSRTNIRRKRKVTWMRSSTPKNRPAGIDQVLMSNQHSALSPRSGLAKGRQHHGHGMQQNNTLQHAPKVVLWLDRQIRKRLIP